MGKRKAVLRVAGGGPGWQVAGMGRGATASRPWVQGGRDVIASLPSTSEPRGISGLRMAVGKTERQADASPTRPYPGVATGSDTFRIPNEVRPHCAAH